MEPQLPAVLLLGDPRLRQISAPVADVHDKRFIEEKSQLQQALAKFRAENGFGRAISAPQIGIMRRLIALDLGGNPFCMINPVIVETTSETFTMWDDCMSFPWLMVKVSRFKNISVEYTNEDGDLILLSNLDQATSELLQHEMDHLDGVLAIDRAIDKNSVISRSVYNTMTEYFDNHVDYVIVPTIKQA